MPGHGPPPHYVPGEVVAGMTVMAPFKRDGARKLEAGRVTNLSTDGLVADVVTTGEVRPRMLAPFAICRLRRPGVPEVVS